MIKRHLLIIWTVVAGLLQIQVTSAECGQSMSPPPREYLGYITKKLAAPITIDYAVFYTPEARNAAGGTSEIEARIANAFQGANELFALSGAQLIHRIVHVQELPLNNTSRMLHELNTELARGFNFVEVLDAVKSDSTLIIVNSQSPGGYANIPITKSQARRGGMINLGLPNVSPGVLAHEIGHTLGASHDYVESKALFFDIPPNNGNGNHFIGKSSNACYRTIMSAITMCRVPGYENQPAIPCDLFSNPNIMFDGTPTGDAIKADAVATFEYFAESVSLTRSLGPPPVPPTPTSTPDIDPDPNRGGADDGDNEGGSPDIDQPKPIEDKLTLRIRKKNRTLEASGVCVTDEEPQVGHRIAIIQVNERTMREKRVATTPCSRAGVFKTPISRGGRFKARNLQTGLESSVVRAPK